MLYFKIMFFYHNKILFTVNYEISKLNFIISKIIHLFHNLRYLLQTHHIQKFSYYKVQYHCSLRNRFSLIPSLPKTIVLINFNFLEDDEIKTSLKNLL